MFKYFYFQMNYHDISYSTIQMTNKIIYLLWLLWKSIVKNKNNWIELNEIRIRNPIISDNSLSLCGRLNNLFDSKPNNSIKVFTWMNLTYISKAFLVKVCNSSIYCGALKPMHHDCTSQNKVTLILESLETFHRPLLLQHSLVHLSFCFQFSNSASSLCSRRRAGYLNFLKIPIFSFISQFETDMLRPSIIQDYN